jgi:hypothetical protein
MAFDDRSIAWLGPLAFVSAVSLVALPVIGAFGYSGTRAGALLVSIILCSWAALWLVLNAFDIVDRWRQNN